MKALKQFSLVAIVKRDGRKQQYDRGKITMATWQSLWAVSEVRRLQPDLTDVDEIARRAADIEVPHEKADKKSRLWKEADRLSQIVERILICSNGHHYWTVEEIQDIREQALMAAGQEAAAKAYILYRNRKAQERERKALNVKRKAKEDQNLEMSENAMAAMARRYLWKDKEGNVTESPKQAMVRVADCVSDSKSQIQNSKLKTKSEKNTKHWREQYLEIMTGFEFVPAGCYFRGAGNKQNGSLANCFVLPVEDSIEKIFDAVKWAALIHQAGGGAGMNFSHLRPRGDAIKSGGLASGPINFMKAFDAETQIVMQGGTHRGANMGILNVDHPDIFEFIRAKAIDGEVSNFNISVGVFDQFMRALQRGGDWPLVNPRDKSIVQKIPARQLWEQIINLAHQTGDPGMIYLDAINRANPVLKSLGPIESTNVCGEQPLHPFDVCNLGSINLAKFVKHPFWMQISNLKSQISKPQLKTQNYQTNIDWQRLEEVVRVAVRFLDNGIDASTYPILQIENMAHRLRRIGLGVMGWADMLSQLGVAYDSDEGVKLAEMIMKFIQDVSWDESEKLAREKDEFPLWEESYFNSKKNPFGKIRKVRNVAVTTIAPTGTISMIADCSSGIEPYFALEYTKNVVDKEGLKYMNRYYEEAKRKINSRLAGYQVKRLKVKGSANLPTFQPSNLSASANLLALLSKIFRTAHQISPQWHVKMQAAFQKYTDNAVSKTINFPSSATVQDIEKAYMLAWELGCKGITVYRDGSREGQILKDEGRRTKDEGNTGAPAPALQSSAFSPRPSTQRLMQSQMTVTPLSQRAYKYQRQQIVDDAAGSNCPECGTEMEMVEGCSMCRSCGYSRCSI